MEHSPHIGEAQFVDDVGAEGSLEAHVVDRQERPGLSQRLDVAVGGPQVERDEPGVVVVAVHHVGRPAGPAQHVERAAAEGGPTQVFIGVRRVIAAAVEEFGAVDELDIEHRPVLAIRVRQRRLRHTTGEGPVGIVDPDVPEFLHRSEVVAVAAQAFVERQEHPHLVALTVQGPCEGGHDVGEATCLREGGGLGCDQGDLQGGDRREP